MSKTYRDKYNSRLKKSKVNCASLGNLQSEENRCQGKFHKRRKKVHTPLPPRVEKKEERRIWVGDEAVIEKHFLHLTRQLRDEER